LEDLSAIVRGNEVETLLHNARLTRDWPDSQQRSQEANRQVRMAMYKAALGQISDEERDRILEILRRCCPELFAAVVPPSEHGWELPRVV
jgi:hypothetical protein